MFDYLIKGIQLRNDWVSQYVPGLNVAAVNLPDDSPTAPRYGGIITDTPLMQEQRDKRSRWADFERAMEALKIFRLVVFGVRRNPMFVPLLLMELQTRVNDPAYIEDYAETYVEVTEGAGVNSVEYITGGMTY